MTRVSGIKPHCCFFTKIASDFSGVLKTDWAEVPEWVRAAWSHWQQIAWVALWEESRENVDMILETGAQNAPMFVFCYLGGNVQMLIYYKAAQLFCKHNFRMCGLYIGSPGYLTGWHHLYETYINHWDIRGHCDHLITSGTFVIC